MKIYVDTNIILDYLIPREEFLEDASFILGLSTNNEIYEFMSSTIVTDIFYNAKKNTKLNSSETQSRIRDLLLILDILPTTKRDIINALDRNWKDFEDAVQYSVAVNNGVDYIISRNPKDFEDNTVPVLTPMEFKKIIDSH